MSSSNARQTSNRSWQYAGLAALAFAVIVVVALLMLRHSSAVTQQTEPAVVATTPTPTPTPTQTVPERPEVNAAEALRNADEPWKLVVLGDSTGNDATEWVTGLGKNLAVYGRPVVLNVWSMDGGYSEPVQLASGQGEPITIWNASAPGQNADYSLENLKPMLPNNADLVIVNHGHNHQNGDGVESIQDLIAAVDRRLGTPPLAVTLQNPLLQPTDTSEALVSGLREQYDGTNVALIDVYSAFEAHSNPGSLMMDGIHPNQAGQDIWLETVIDALELNQAT